jgi:hypothetical protein
MHRLLSDAGGNMCSIPLENRIFGHVENHTVHT